MQRKLSVIPFILALFILLSACSSGEAPEATAKNIQEEFSSASEVHAVLSLTADYGEKVYDFKLSCDFTGDAGTITITEPESIAGTEIKISEDSSTLIYDGAEMYTGEIMSEGISPVDTVPIMLKSWKEGLITESVSEKYGDNDCVAVRFRVDDDTTLTTWFCESTHLPIHAEFMCGGRTVILCDFENVRVE